MRTRVVRAVAAVLLGALGMGLFQAGAHVWRDHQRLHEILQALNRAQQGQGR